MNTLRALGAIFTLSLMATPTRADQAAQPPMNDFNQAFYICGNNTAFIVSYDNNPPQAATLTTSNNNKTYQLKRADSGSGVTFTNAVVTFWTDGVSVKLRGTSAAYENCKIKAN
jgi:membrane-bound inhibitor of C-type lysozyme